MIYLKCIVDKDFMLDYVADLMKRKALQWAEESDMANMNTYLRDTYNISVADIINQVYDCYEVNMVADTLIFRINALQLERRSQQNLSALVRLVEYGNRDVNGTKLLARLKQYINDNIKEFYALYLYNNEEEKTDEE